MALKKREDDATIGEEDESGSVEVNLGDDREDEDDDGDDEPAAAATEERAQTRREQRRDRYRENKERAEQAERRAAMAEQQAMFYREQAMRQTPQQQPPNPQNDPLERELNAARREADLLLREWNALSAEEQAKRQDDFNKRSAEIQERRIEVIAQRRIREMQMHAPQQHQNIDQQVKRTLILSKYHDVLGDITSNNPALQAAAQQRAAYADALHRAKVLGEGKPDTEATLDEVMEETRRRFGIGGKRRPAATESEKERYMSQPRGSGSAGAPRTVVLTKMDRRMAVAAFPKDPPEVAYKRYARGMAEEMKREKGSRSVE
jgi:hypothetical protein